MIRRTIDATQLNEIANSPAVRPALGPGNGLDLSGLLDNTNNVGLVGESGGFLVEKMDDFGLYECHSMFLPNGKTLPVEAAHEALRYMFIETDCSEIITKLPQLNNAAKGLARATGFRTLFERIDAFEYQSGECCDVAYASLPYMRWVATAPNLEEHGKWFHTRLEQLTEGRIPEHTEEPIHNRMVGAAVLMFRVRNSLKGAAFYNRWARFAGYDAVRLISINPTIIDMGIVTIEVSWTDMEVLRCQSV